MKAIYTIRLSEDGLWFEAYSNKKALWKVIEYGLESYEDCRVIETAEEKNGKYKLVKKPFNYANLVKILNKQSNVTLTNGTSSGSTMQIMTLDLKSK